MKELRVLDLAWLEGAVGFKVHTVKEVVEREDGKLYGVRPIVKSTAPPFFQYKEEERQ
jgi:hypothetical protein